MFEYRHIYCLLILNLNILSLMMDKTDHKDPLLEKGSSMKEK